MESIAIKSYRDFASNMFSLVENGNKLIDSGKLGKNNMYYTYTDYQSNNGCFTIFICKKKSEAGRQSFITCKANNYEDDRFVSIVTGKIRSNEDKSIFKSSLAEFARQNNYQPTINIWNTAIDCISIME